MASTSSVWPLPWTPAIATISPAWTVEVQAVDGRVAAVVADDEVVQLEDRLAGLRRLLFDDEVDRRGRPSWPPAPPRVVSAGVVRADHLAAAQHGDAVGDLEDLVELVGDEDDRGADLDRASA